jgi:hypothetical protein
MIGGGTWEGAPMFGMRRREVISLLGGAAVASSLWPLSLRAQQVQKSYRVDYLALAGDQDAVIVKQRLAELGYAEGKNLSSTSAPPKDTWSACPRSRWTSSKPIRT